MRTKNELYQEALRTVARRRQTARARAEDARAEAEAARLYYEHVFYAVSRERFFQLSDDLAGMRGRAARAAADKHLFSVTGVLFQIRARLAYELSYLY